MESREKNNATWELCKKIQIDLDSWFYTIVKGLSLGLKEGQYCVFCYSSDYINVFPNSFALTIFICPLRVSKT